MAPVEAELTVLDGESRRIVGLICAEIASAEELDRAIRGLREQVVAAFPDAPDVFEQTYGRRFQRLRTRFRPGRGLFESGT